MGDQQVRGRLASLRPCHPDLVGLQAELAARDVRMLEPEPVRGAGDFLCNFVHPVSTRGIIIEYVQPL